MYPMNKFLASMVLLGLSKASVNGHRHFVSQLLLLLLKWSSDRSFKGSRGPLLVRGAAVSSHTAT